MKIIDDIKENSISYGGIPFWSWNDKLSDDTLKRQINDMHKNKMNGFLCTQGADLKQNISQISGSKP